MKYLKTAIAFAAAGLCASMSVLNVFGAANEFIVDFNGVSQAKSNWCWAASAEASGHHAYEYSTRSQYDAAAYILGSSSYNEGATIDETARAATHIAHNYVTYQYYTSIPMSEFLISKIVQDKVTIVFYCYYDTSGNYNGAHAVTIKRISVDQTTGEKTIYFYDPLYDGVYHASASDLYNGTAVYDMWTYFKFEQCAYY